jgi:hypothetical protein
VSITDPEADPVQPEGQGGEGNEAPYAEYLNRIPEEVRGDVEPVFKDWDANTTRKFQEHAQYRQNWEPYEQLGVNQIAPEDMEGLLAFHQAAQNDPQAIQLWFQEYAQANNLTPEQAADQLDQQSTLDEYGTGFDAQAFQQALTPMLQPLQQQLEQMNRWREQQEQNARLQEANQHIERQFKELEGKPDFNREAIEHFLPKYVNSDPRNAVPKAYQDYQQMRAQIEKQYVQSKSNIPAGAEHGGTADGSFEPAKTLEEAKAQALARFAQLRQS